MYALSQGSQGSSWQSVAPLQMGRFYHAVATFQGKIYAAGGAGFGNGNGILSSVEVFDGLTWQAGPTLTRPRDRFGLAATVVAGNCFLYAYGGGQVSRGTECPFVCLLLDLSARVYRLRVVSYSYLTLIGT